MQQQQLSNIYSICQLATYPAQERVWCVQWDPSGTFLAISGSNKVITLYRYSDATKQLIKLQTIPTQHTKTIRYLKFSSNYVNMDSDKKLNIPSTNCPILAAASFDATISIWVTTNQQKQQIQQYQQLCLLQGHQNQVKCVSWNYDNTKLASCSRDKNIWIWQFDEISYEYTCENVLEGHTQDVKYVQWINPTCGTIQGLNLNRLASCGYDDTIKIWQMQDDDYSCKYTLNGHNSIVWSLSFSPKCDRFISTSQDCSVSLWKQINVNQNPNSFELIKQNENFHKFPIYCCKIIQMDNNLFCLTGSGDNMIKLSKIEQNGQLTTISQGTHLSDINHINVRPSSTTSNIIFASCSDDETVKLWEIRQS